MHYSRAALQLAGWWLFASTTVAQHQTSNFSPVSVGGVLPYRVQLTETSLGTAELPTLQSYAAAEYDGKWVLVAGRTNGLHGFTSSGGQNFPPAYRNYDVWVVDPVAGQSWRRSLHPDDNENSGLTVNQAVSIGTTNNQFVQLDDTLYLTGGYTGSDTIDALTAIDLPGMVAWVQGGSAMASESIRQVYDPHFEVTGGAMYEFDGKIQLVFGHNVTGGYPNGTQVYTNQVRSFEIQDDGTTLSFSNAGSTMPEPAYRRRDLNVFPVLRPDGAGGEIEGLTALSGVFTEQDGVWTVPVEIDQEGTPTMADPNLPGTFKQAMNQYHSAKFGMYSQSSGTMNEVLMGGITINQYDWNSGTFVQDDDAPNTSQITSVVVDANGEYTQHLLGAFPVILDEHDYYLRLGANGEFFTAPGIPTFDNGVIDFDELPAGDTVVGHVFGGLAANADHVRGNIDPNVTSIASNLVFEVTVSILAGDFNRDGYVNLADYTVWRNSLGASVTVGTHADASGDGLVNAADYTIWKSNFGLANTQPVSLPLEGLGVPEPASWAIAMLSTAAMLVSSRFRRRLAICRE